jgi:hypothetical protein
MGKLFNLATGDQVYIEDCVLENDELDQSIDIPEDINPVEFIDKDLDSQLDEPMLDSFISELGTNKLSLLPSCKTCEEWFNDQYDILEMVRTGYANYIKEYRKELTDWYNLNYKSRIDAFSPMQDRDDVDENKGRIIELVNEVI